MDGFLEARLLSGFPAGVARCFRVDRVISSGPEYVLHYLGRYTHRVAISNHRLVSLVDQKVTFRWRDSAHSNQHKLMTLALDDFLRRFLLHLLPKGFVRIRHFGFLANRRRATIRSRRNVVSINPAAAGVVETVNRRFKGLWENRSLVFPQPRQFPQRFSPATLRYAADRKHT